MSRRSKKPEKRKPARRGTVPARSDYQQSSIMDVMRTAGAVLPAGARLVVQTHDELLLEYPTDRVFAQANRYSLAAVADQVLGRDSSAHAAELRRRYAEASRDFEVIELAGDILHTDLLRSWEQMVDRQRGRRRCRCDWHPREGMSRDLQREHHAHHGRPTYHTSLGRAPRLRLGMHLLTHAEVGEVLFGVAERAGRRNVGNRHDARRIIRRIASTFMVASDSLLEGNRPLAIRVLCDVVCLDLAIRLTRDRTAEPVGYEEWHKARRAWSNEPRERMRAHRATWGV